MTVRRYALIGCGVRGISMYARPLARWCTDVAAPTGIAANRSIEWGRPVAISELLAGSAPVTGKTV